jgi:hypothetical protein
VGTTEVPNNRSAEILRTLSAGLTLPLQIRNSDTATNTAVGIALRTTTSTFTNAGADVKSVRTDFGGTGSSDFVIATSVGTTITDKFWVKSTGKVENPRTLVTTTGTGTYLLNFSNNEEYERTLTGISVLGVSGTAVIGDERFISLTGNFAISFASSGHTFIGDAAINYYGGGLGTTISIRCVATNKFLVSMIYN